jgi:hypothetical protein
MTHFVQVLNGEVKQVIYCVHGRTLLLLHLRLSTR